MTAADEAIAFIRTLSWAQVPAAVRERVAWLFLDASAAAEAGRALDSSRIAARFATVAFGGDAATCLFDGSRVSAPGAAWANGTLMNALDLDDGHALAKGHPGAVVIPAALAVAELTRAHAEELVSAVVVGYEIAVRAAVQQHRRWPLFHSTGAWGALGAAAAAAHLLKLEARQVDSALGLAEYHAPTDLIMRAVAAPSMAKDAMGWGAQVGVASAMLAADGFTAHRSEFLEGRPGDGAGDGMNGDGLGARWEILDTYVKPFPCCRWTHPSLSAARAVLDRLGATALRPDQVARIEVRTFEAAAGLSRGVPTTSEQAQFNLPWPIACMLATGRFDLASVTTDLGDAAVADLMSRIEITVDPELSALFPQVRRSELRVTLSDGSTVASGEAVAAGDPDDPWWTEVVRAKLRPGQRRLLDTGHLNTEPAPTPVSGLSLTGLMSVLTYPLKTTTKDEPMHTAEQTKRLEAIDGLAEAFRARAPGLDRDAAFPEQNFRDLHEAGLMALTLPVKWGGAGLWGEEGFVAYYEVLEHLASVDSPTAQLLQVHLHAIGMLAHAATEEQAHRYLIPIVEAGQRVASVGSESVPGKKTAGASVSEMTRRADGSWSLTCEKHFASLGPGADYFIIWLAVPGREDYDQRSVAVLVPRDAPEVEMIDNWDTLGMRATVSMGVRITDLTVPEDAVFGEPGWWESSDHRTFTLGFASNHLGAARGALRFTTDWVRERPQLAGSEVIQFQIGEMAANLRAARSALFEAARLWEGDDPAAAEYASVQALIVAKRVSLEVTQRALDVCGARSMFKTFELEQIFRDTRTFTLHYRVDNYTRELGAAMLAGGFAVKGNGGITAVEN